MHNGNALTLNNKPIQLVCFDLGGVLIRICGGWVEACSRAGIAVPPAIADKAVAARVVAVSHEHERGRIDDASYAAGVAGVLGISDDDVLAVSRAWLKGPYAGAHEVVDDLRRAGRRTACLSNTNALHWSMMSGEGGNQLPLTKLDHRFTSFETGWMKPEASLYAHVEQGAGVAPDTILFFDDNTDNCRAAAARGWRVRQIDPAGDTIAQVRRTLREHQLL